MSIHDSWDVKSLFSEVWEALEVACPQTFGERRLWAEDGEGHGHMMNVLVCQIMCMCIKSLDK